MKVKIERDEYYPFHSIEEMPPEAESARFSVVVGVNKNTVKRWERVLSEFHDVQEEIEQVYLEEAKKEHKPEKG